MTEPGPELDAARRRVVAEGLMGDAIDALTPVVGELPMDALGPMKQQLKRFFSEESWTAADDDALAAAAQGGTSSGRHELEPGLVLTWGWDDGRFRLRVENE
jgi:hypothetical protein